MKNYKESKAAIQELFEAIEKTNPDLAAFLKQRVIFNEQTATITCDGDFVGDVPGIHTQL